MKSESNKCPLCNEPVDVQQGHQTHPNDSNYGVTIDCKNTVCPMADWGHGKNENAAFEVFRQKCGL